MLIHGANSHSLDTELMQMDCTPLMTKRELEATPTPTNVTELKSYLGLLISETILLLFHSHGMAWQSTKKGFV